jgi:hypothetical protein
MNATAHRPPPGDLLVVVLGGALTALALFALPGVVALRVILGVPFLILGPGYSLTSAVFPHDPPDLSMRVALSLGLSIASAVLAGLVLNAVRIELTAHALLVAQLTITVVSCLVAWVRRGEPIAPVRPVGPAVLRSPWFWSTALLLAVFASLLALLARPLPDRAFAGYTQLAALRAAHNGISATVRSAEQVTRSYRLVAVTASRRVVSREFTLSPGQEWAGTLPTGGPPDQTIYIRLYRAGQPGVIYREVVHRA